MTAHHIETAACQAVGSDLHVIKTLAEQRLVDIRTARLPLPFRCTLQRRNDIRDTQTKLPAAPQLVAVQFYKSSIILARRTPVTLEKSGDAFPPTGHILLLRLHGHRRKAQQQQEEGTDEITVQSFHQLRFSVSFKFIPRQNYNIFPTFAPFNFI